MKPFLGLWRNNANLLGKCGQVVLLGLVRNTTKNFQSFYGGIIWVLKHTKNPHKPNIRTINSFLHVTQVCTTLANF